MKPCNKCGELKPLYEFKKNSRCKMGVTNTCKICVNSALNAWRKENPNHSKGNRREVSREWAKRNAEYIKLKGRIYKEENRGKVNAWEAKRRASRMLATPSWLSGEHIKEIEAIYMIASWYDEPMHVDHIVPLQGKNVCGLHVPWNLQILSAEENRRKSNSWPNTH